MYHVDLQLHVVVYLIVYIVKIKNERTRFMSEFPSIHGNLLFKMSCYTRTLVMETLVFGGNIMTFILEFTVKTQNDC
jgi:hypothetical protein